MGNPYGASNPGILTPRQKQVVECYIRNGFNARKTGIELGISTPAINKVIHLNIAEDMIEQARTLVHEREMSQEAVFSMEWMLVEITRLYRSISEPDDLVVAYKNTVSRELKEFFYSGVEWDKEVIKGMFEEMEKRIVDELKNKTTVFIRLKKEKRDALDKMIRYREKMAESVTDRELEITQMSLTEIEEAAKALMKRVREMRKQMNIGNNDV